MKLLKPLFAFVFLIASNLVFLERVLDMVSRQRWVSLIIYLGIWGICTTSFVLTLFHENKLIQIFGGIVMAISTAFGMSYLNIGGHFLNYMDMELLWISRGHAMKALLFYIDHLLCWGTPNELRTFEYWQSCFNKWQSHPYSWEKDLWRDKKVTISRRLKKPFIPCFPL